MRKENETHLEKRLCTLSLPPRSDENHTDTDAHTHTHTYIKTHPCLPMHTFIHTQRERQTAANGNICLEDSLQRFRGSAAVSNLALIIKR